MRVTVRPEASADDEETATLRDLVRSMLVEHDFDVADRRLIAAPPQGTKGVDPVSLSTLVVTLAASGGVLTTLVGALQAWLLRSSARQVVLEIDGDRLEVNGVTGAERRQLTAEWLRRHQPSAGAGGPDERQP